MLAGMKEETSYHADSTPLSHVFSGVKSPSTEDFPEWMQPLPDRRLEGLDNATLGDLRKDLGKLEHKLESLVEDFEIPATTSEVLNMENADPFVNSDPVKQAVTEQYIAYRENEYITIDQTADYCGRELRDIGDIEVEQPLSAKRLTKQLLSDHHISNDCTKQIGVLLGAYCLANGGELDL